MAKTLKYTQWNVLAWILSFSKCQNYMSWSSSRLVRGYTLIGSSIWLTPRRESLIGCTDSTVSSSIRHTSSRTFEVLEGILRMLSSSMYHFVLFRIITLRACFSLKISIRLSRLRGMRRTGNFAGYRRFWSTSTRSKTSTASKKNAGSSKTSRSISRKMTPPSSHRSAKEKA